MNNPQTHNPQIKRYLYKKAAAKHIPIGGTFELTPRCNMNCRMCYIRMTKEKQESLGRERTAAEWIALGKTCRDMGMLFLLLTGGEPLLRPDFCEIYESLYRLGLVISINTNGTLLTPQIVEMLKAMPPEKVNVTLYGGSREAYERLCGYEDGYDRAVNGILMLKEAGVRVSVNNSYTGENVEELEKIAAFIKEHDLPARVTTYMFPPVRKGEGGEEVVPHRMSPEQAGRTWWQSEHYRLKEEVWEVTRARIIAGIPAEDKECVLDEKMRCMAGRSVFWVTWNWQFRGCGMLTYPTEHIEVENFPEAWQRLGVEIDRLRIPKACTGCKYRSACVVCGAVIQAEGQGNMEEAPEYVCRMTKEYVRLVKEEMLCCSGGAI